MLGVFKKVEQREQNLIEVQGDAGMKCCNQKVQNIMLCSSQMNCY